MPRPPRRFPKSLLLACALTGCLPHAPAALGRQEPARQEEAAAQDDEEVVRIDTELIQTGVMVFDKSGKFVEGLRQEDFELTVEGKPAPVSFFERVAAEPPSSSPPPSGAAAATSANAAPPAAAGGARTVIFFADDLHLSFESRKRARDLIGHLVEEELSDEDVAAVVSSSGRLGFLQQFTDNRAVLREAAARLGDDRGREAGDRLQPPMSEYEAFLIDRYDPQVTDEFASAVLSLGLAMRREDAVDQARARARNVLQQAALFSKTTYRALEQTVRRSAQMPGRKIILLVSDGFLLDTTNTDAAERLRRITDAAARANAVVYAFDPRGLDASMPAGRAAHAFRVQSGERSEMQEPLNSIARETGGRFVKNTNDLRPGVSQALAEASRYYLLAWRPDAGPGGGDKLRRIEVRVKGRPELAVRLQSGYLPETPKELPKAAAKAAKPEASNPKAAPPPPPPTDPAQEQLRAALNSVTSKTELPTSLSANYLEAEGGSVLAASLRVEGSAVAFTREGESAKAEVDVVGVVYDSKGKAEAAFSRRLTLSAPASSVEGGRRENVYYNYQTKLAPGLHQLRVAARDVKTGRLGSAVQWVEIPDLSKRRLVLSSLLVAEARAAAPQRPAAADARPEPAAAEISVDRRFERTSALRYMVYVYNARADAAAPPDVTVQTQVSRANRAVMAAPPSRVSPEGQDPARLAYAAELPLAGLPPGRYSLRVTVNDLAAGTTAAQRVTFVVK
ncbi:MAG TPA: VWA domain-containing protein [Pyrinomonadaceae bacterium]|jgi:VWFA-related protein